MESITKFINNFDWLSGLVTLSAVLVALVVVLWADYQHRKKMSETYF